MELLFWNKGKELKIYSPTVPPPLFYYYYYYYYFFFCAGGCIGGLGWRREHWHLSSASRFTATVPVTNGAEVVKEK